MLFEKKLVYTEPARILADRPCRADDEALCMSIAENGILTPLTVCRGADGEYRLADGGRRLSAAKKTGLKKVPCFVLDGGAEETALYSLALHLTALPEAERPASALSDVKTRFELTESDILLKTGLPAEIFAEPAKRENEDTARDETYEIKKRPERKIYSGTDIRFFMNSILRVTDLMRENGIPVTVEKKETETAAEFVILLPRPDRG